MADVIHGPRAQLLATIVQLEAPMTVRAIARHAGVAPQTALTVIKDLADAGVVSAEAAGRAQMVSLNREHLLAEPLIALTRTRARLIDRLGTELTNWTGLAGAWLYGSAARGTGDRESDIDILLVAEEDTETTQWSESAARLVDQVLRWTGNQAHLIEHSRSSFAELVRDKNQLVAAIRDEGVGLIPSSARLLQVGA
jgi:predicted nucleotidyltransferase